MATQFRAYCPILVMIISLYAPVSANAEGIADQEPTVGSTLHSKQSLLLENVPSDAIGLIKDSYPDFQARESEKEFKHGNVYLDIEGELAGKEIEFDLLQTPTGWEIVEVQRDIAEAELPEAVGNEVHDKLPNLKPARIIESVQHGTSITIYELYFVDTNGVESKAEIKLENGLAMTLDSEWEH